MECLDRLPLYCSSSDDVPSMPAAGECVTALAAITAGSLSLSVGQTAYYDGSSWNVID